MRSTLAYRSLRGIREPFEVVVRTVDEVEKSKFVVMPLVKKVVEQGKLVDDATANEVRKPCLTRKYTIASKQPTQ